MLKLPTPIDDPELLQLLAKIGNLNSRDRDAVKAVLEAMLMKSRMEDLMLKRGA